MHVRPPCMCCHVRHPPTSWMCCMNRFNIGIFNWVGDGDGIIYTYTIVFEMEVLPKAMDVRAYLAAPVLVACRHTVPGFLEYCILWCEARHQSTGEYLGQRKVDSARTEIICRRWSHCRCVRVWGRCCCRHQGSCRWACFTHKPNFSWCGMFHLHECFFIWVRHH